MVFWIIWSFGLLLLISWPLFPTLKKMILNRPTFGAGRDAALLKFMRQAHRNLCYDDIQTMEHYLYGKNFEHLGSTPGDWSRERYQHGSHSREWDQEFRLPETLAEQAARVQSRNDEIRRKRKGETTTVRVFGERGIEEVEIEL